METRVGDSGGRGAQRNSTYFVQAEDVAWAAGSHLLALAVLGLNIRTRTFADILVDVLGRHWHGTSPVD